MNLTREILRLLFAGGISYRQIGESLGISHNTVSRYDQIRSEKNIDSSKIDLMDDSALDAIFNSRTVASDSRKPLPDFDNWHSELKIQGVTLEILWQEYKSQYTHGYSYAHVTRLYRIWAKKLNATMRQTHLAGEKLFLDYSGKRLPITNRETGEITMAEIYVAVMGASNYTYVEASRSQQVGDWLQSNANALTYFGGSPTMLVPDNLKSAVLKNKKRTIQLNPQYVEFARHYGTVIIPTRPRKPKDKAKVEAGIRIVQMWILAKLRHHVFYSIAEANAAILELLEIFNNRPFKKIAGSRSELFKRIDQPALRPLPSQPYEYATWRINVRVGLDYLVDVEDCWYMVPHTLVDQRVDIRATSSTIEVFCKNRRVASYARLFTPGEMAINRDFMPAAHQRHSEWSPSRLKAWAQSVGESTEKLFSTLLENKHPERGFRTCIRLIGIGKAHGLDRFESAAAVALQINSPTLSSVCSVLRTGRDRLQPHLVAFDDGQVLPQTQRHDNIRGAQYYR